MKPLQKHTKNKEARDDDGKKSENILLNVSSVRLNY